jgi:hypothetical protein
MLVREADDGDVFVFRKYRSDVHRYQGEALRPGCGQRAVPDKLPENTGLVADSQPVEGKFVWGWGSWWWINDALLLTKNQDNW